MATNFVASSDFTRISTVRLPFFWASLMVALRTSAGVATVFPPTSRIFITGANGFIGGAVASALIADGHTVRDLVRSKAKADAVQPTASKQSFGSLDDAALLQAEARAAIWLSRVSVATKA